MEVKTLSEKDLSRADLIALIALGYKPSLRARLIAENGEIVETERTIERADPWSTLDLVSKSFR